MQIVTGIEVNSEAYFPKLGEYCPSDEGSFGFCFEISILTSRYRLRKVRLFLRRRLRIN